MKQNMFQQQVTHKQLPISTVEKPKNTIIK